MADVAKVAGVHTTTVSLSLRNHPSIPPTTRERIKNIATQMGYRPDPAISALMARRRSGHKSTVSTPLAYLTNRETEYGWRESPAHLEFYEGAKRRADELGYRLNHFWIGESGLTGRRLAEILSTRGIPGVIIASHEEETDFYEEFDWNAFSAVKIDHFPTNPMLHLVTNDQSAIIRLGMRRLMELGYQRIGFFMPSWWDNCVQQAWSAGFLASQRKFCQKNQIPILEFEAPGFDIPSKVFQEWYQKYHPDALLTYHKFLEPLVEKLKLRIPEDVAFADIFLLDTSGQTAGIRQNCQRVGEVAVEQVVGQIMQNVRGLPDYPTVTMVEGTWHYGHSLPAMTGFRKHNNATPTQPKMDTASTSQS